MKKNVGNTEKWIRIVLGIVIIALGFYFQSWWGLVGFVPLLTGFVGLVKHGAYLEYPPIKRSKLEKYKYFSPFP